jgi:hypothetical protein
MTRSSPRVLFLGAVLALAGCGGSDARAPEARSARDLATPDGALAALDEAERALDGVFPRAAPGGVSAASAVPQAQPPPPPPVAPQKPGDAPAIPQQMPQLQMSQGMPGQAPPTAAPPSTAGRADKREEAPRQPVASDPCSTACSALASMERAASHLCNLTGDGDARCQSARTRTQSAAARVRASCPSCSGA